MADPGTVRCAVHGAVQEALTATNSSRVISELYCSALSLSFIAQPYHSVSLLSARNFAFAFSASRYLLAGMDAFTAFDGPRQLFLEGSR